MSDQNNLTIAEKQTKLAELVGWFESDEFVVEDAYKKFEEAENLAKEIEEELSEQKNKITVLKKRFDQEQ